MMKCFPLYLAVFSSSLILFGSLLAAEQNSRDARVLIIGIDGLRPDALEQASTPNLDRLIAEGAYANDAQILGEYRENDTVSGASWSSILTGVWANKHGVHDNTFQGVNFREYPHFFERVKAAHPEAKTISMVSWEPIDTHIVSGADIRHVEYLAAGELLDFSVSADEVDINTRDGHWHHLVGKRMDGKVSLFLNGRRLATMEDVSGDFDLTGDFYYLGRDARGDVGLFRGRKDQVRWWNRALPASEIESIASSGPPGLWGKTAGPDDLDRNRLLADYRGVLDGLQVAITPQLAAMTQGDWSLETWFQTTDSRRQILMGNHVRGRNALNLELQTNNRVRIYMSPRWSRIDHEDDMDGAMASAAAAMIRDEDPAAMFVYFHQTDLVGHTLGFSPDVPRYMDAVENVDRHVGRVLEAIASRPTNGDEAWLVIVCTDHGGLGYRHGGGHNDPEILTVPLIVSGLSARRGAMDKPTYIVDVVPTALTHLGIEIDPAWGLDGRPAGLQAP